MSTIIGKSREIVPGSSFAAHIIVIKAQMRTSAPLKI